MIEITQRDPAEIVPKLLDERALSFAALLLVEKMRKAQATYFKTKNTNDLRIAKDAERAADAAVAAALVRLRGAPEQGSLL